MSWWPQWIYQYGVGGLFFALTVLLAVYVGAVRWRHPPDRRLLLSIAAALIVFAAIHAVWIALAAG